MKSWAFLPRNRRLPPSSWVRRAPPNPPPPCYPQDGPSGAPLQRWRSRPPPLEEKGGFPQGKLGSTQGAKGGEGSRPHGSTRVHRFLAPPVLSRRAPLGEAGRGGHGPHRGGRGQPYGQPRRAPGRTGERGTPKPGCPVLRQERASLSSRNLSFAKERGGPGLPRGSLGAKLNPGGLPPKAHPPGGGVCGRLW